MTQVHDRAKNAFAGQAVLQGTRSGRLFILQQARKASLRWKTWQARQVAQALDFGWLGTDCSVWLGSEWGPFLTKAFFSPCLGLLLLRAGSHGIRLTTY